MRTFHVVRLSLSSKRRRYVTDHGHISVGILPAGSGETELEGEDAGLGIDLNQYWFTSSAAVPIETVVSHTFLPSSEKSRLDVLGRTILSLSEPPREYTDTGFEVTFKKRKVWRCFPRVFSCCCGAPKAKNMFYIRHGVDRCHPFVRCAISFDDMVRG